MPPTPRVVKVTALALVTALLVGCAVLPPGGGPGARLLTRADALVDRGDYRAAAALYRQVVEQHGGSAAAPEALLGLGRVALAPDNPDRNPRDALETFERLLRQYPASPAARQGRTWHALLVAIQTLEQELALAGLEGERLREEAGRLRAELAARVREIEAAREEVGRARREADAMEREVTLARQAAEDARGQARQLEAERHRQSEQLNSARREIERLQRELQAAVEQARQMREDIEQLKRLELERARRRR